MASASSFSAFKPWKHYESDFTGGPDVYSFIEDKTSTWQYIVADSATSEAVLIDPVLDYDPVSGTVKTDTADGLLSFINGNNFKVVRILETHAHADHLTASQYMKTKLKGNIPICIGSRITQVQNKFAPVYGLDSKYLVDTFDVYLKDDEKFNIGNIECQVMHLPGHTPDHLGYLIGQSVFTGDSIFMPDVGSARADFPGGNAKTLYHSLRRLLDLPPSFKLFVGHDYPTDRGVDCVTTVAEHNENNRHIKVGTSEEEFVELREARDRVLGTPRLLHPSLQVNVRAGHLPPSDEYGMFMRIPVRLRSPAF